MTERSTPDSGTEHQDAPSDEEEEFLALLEDDSDEEHADDEQDDIGEEDDLDADTDEEDDAEGGSNDQSESGRFVQHDGKVRLSDGTVTTVGELVRGNLREADYTRKTQALAEKERGYSEGSQRVAQRETELAKSIEWNAAVLKAIQPPEPDPELINSNLQLFEHQKLARAQWEKLTASIEGRAKEAYEAHRTEMAKKRQEWADREADLLPERVPALKDDKRLDQFEKDIQTFAGKYGYQSADEILNVADSRALAILYKAIQYDKLQANKGKVRDKTRGKPPVRPGRREAPGTGKKRNQTNDMKVLRSTGGRGPEGEAAAIRLFEDSF